MKALPRKQSVTVVSQDHGAQLLHGAGSEQVEGDYIYHPLVILEYAYYPSVGS